MALNPNMVAIQTITVGAGGTASVVFSNIPQTYSDLVIKASVRTSRTANADTLNITVNGGTTYQNRALFGNGSSVSNAPTSTFEMVWTTDASSTANAFGNSEVYIANYRASSSKAALGDSVTENNGTTAYQAIIAGYSDSSTAINTITLTSNTSSTILQYSTFTLYGITSASYGLKATGGVIYQDADYMYHVFRSSGIFTPTQSLTAQVLVVAGGGAGGGNFGGGGGAGGLSYHSAKSLTGSTNYTVTIGAGGVATSNQSGSNSVFHDITSNGGGVGGGSGNVNGTSGGSGGGPCRAGTVGSATQGNTGGATGYGNASGTSANGFQSGGGGGAGSVGSNGSGTTDGTSTGGAGGVGLNTWSTWASATNSGDNGYYAGGGGGASRTSNLYGGGAGGLGGGGAGGRGTGAPGGNPGLANTGGGGGGATDDVAITGNGGSGIVIVRYAK